MGEPHWTVGEVARHSGLSVRALHHYDEIGLLHSRRRSPAGYRLYGEADLARLQQIMSLRALGLALNEIRSLLDDPRGSPGAVITAHIQRLEEGIVLQQELIERLQRLADLLARRAEVDADDILKVLEVMKVVDNFGKYYTPEQLDELRQRRETVGEERIRAVEAEWPQLMVEMRAAMERDADPGSPEVQVLAVRWKGLIAEFSGGNPGIGGSLQRMYSEDTEARRAAGLDPALFAYVGRALRGG